MSAFGGKADMPFCTAKADFDILHSRLKANRFQIGKAVHTKAVLRDLHASKSALPAKPPAPLPAGFHAKHPPRQILEVGPWANVAISLFNSKFSR